MSSKIIDSWTEIIDGREVVIKKYAPAKYQILSNLVLPSAYSKGTGFHNPRNMESGTIASLLHAEFNKY